LRKKFLLYFNTIRFLRVSQILNHVGWKIKKYRSKNYKTIFDEEKLNSAPEIILQEKTYISDQNKLDNETKEFSFLNINISYSDKILWNDSSQEKLWLYNLHYFDYLIPLCHNPSSENYATVKKIIKDWIDNNPQGKGNGWEPFPLSLRFVNWVFIYSSFFHFFLRDINFKKKILSSLYQQASFLTHVIEYHIQANHLFTNLKALAFAGIFFNHKKWQNKYIRKLIKEIEEQILKDGGHYERSPMYHSIILTDLIDLVNLINANNIKHQNSLKSGLEELKDNILLPNINRMISWLKIVTQPDGQIPLFGDSDFNFARNPEVFRQYYINVIGKDDSVVDSKTLSSLKNSGYHVFRSNDQYLIFDTGELGVSYQPGHAHCDILSFEYSYNGHRFFVDTGVGNYLESDLRLKARSIYAHNTAVVNGMDQAQLWKAFRVAKRVTSVSSSNGYNWVEGHYTNNIDKKKNYSHQRKIEFVDKKFFILKDSIQTKNPSSIEFLFHINPKAKIEIKKNHIQLSLGDSNIVLAWKAEMSYSLDDWFYCSEFNKIEESKVLKLLPANLQTNTRMPFIITPLTYFEEANTYFDNLSTNGPT